MRRWEGIFMSSRIRPAQTGDLAAINEIYNHYVTTSTATFAEEPTGAAERQQWWLEHEARYPVLVIEADRRLIGWASLSPYIRRSAYRFTVEDSVYLRPEVCGRGLGRALLGELLEAGRAAGFRTVLALICTEQLPSLRLHAGLGFREAGRLIRVGYKFERWLDTVIMQRDL
jgi:phosphinothricin acetyltransferase